MAQDPLAQLEELLAKAKGQRGQSADQATDPAAPAVPTGPTPEEIAAQEKAELQAQMEEQARQGEIIRQSALQELQSQMHTLAETPQDIARRQQEEIKLEEKQSQDSKMQGFEINQISKTKV
ncbi:hypothetical protein KA078_02530 [Candidatus Woesebacteria bacterium]|nr:hypothetical protein [Candidatus Woesebacteria bacterium]